MTSLLRRPMIRPLLMVMALAASAASAGEAFIFPILREASGYQSTKPAYRVVGVEDRKDETIVWVVADRATVTKQARVNRIINDIRRRHRTTDGAPGFTQIWFYASVRDKPQFPAFHIHDYLALYLVEDNKTHYGDGGWAHGPPP